jgi:hypothetical protein
MTTKNIFRFLSVFAFLILLVSATSLAQTKRVIPCDTCPTPTPTPTPTPPPPPPPYNTVAVTQTANNLDYVNGKNIVADFKKVLHAVYSDNGIKYVTSTDYGKTWSSPLTLSTTGITPTVGVDDGRNVGVAYSYNNQIYYLYKQFGGSWGGVTQLTSTYGGKEPSIVGHGSKMYLTWAGYDVYFSTFQTLSPVFVSSPEFVTLHVICSTATYKYPSIALANSTAVEPVVRVAYYNDFTSCSSPTSGVYVQERPVGSNVWIGNYNGYFNEVYTAVSPAVSSISLAANRISGEFYFIYSFRPNGTLWKTGFAKGSSTSNTWDRVDYFGGDTSTPVIADVTAVKQNIGGAPQNGLFKTAYSAQTYGNVFMKQGTWTGTTPTFWSSVKKSTVGRTPHLVDCILDDQINGLAKGINLIYEAPGEIRTDYFEFIAY